MRIQAIPTEHNGVKYRSRTEARWAVFFGLVRLPFIYEPEGYRTDVGPYLPDFQFPDAPCLTFFEVKPDVPTDDELALLAALARGTDAHVFVALGTPRPGVLVWKVAPNGSLGSWYFGREESGRLSYLHSPIRNEQAVLRTDVGSGVYSSGADYDLERASTHNFPLFEDRHGGQDWRVRARRHLDTRGIDARSSIRGLRRG